MMRRFSRRMFGSLLLSTLAGSEYLRAQAAQGSPRL